MSWYVNPTKGEAPIRLEWRPTHGLANRTLAVWLIGKGLFFRKYIVLKSVVSCVEYAYD